MFKSLKQRMESVVNNAGGYLIKGAYSLSNKSHATAPDVLALEPGDGLALVKIVYPEAKNPQQKIYQIVDATGPVGPSHLAFAGTYASFKNEMAKYENSTSFSQQRLDGVNYPFIAPFRTKRLYDSQWSDDWSIKTDVSQFTPGRRFGYNGWELTFGSWKYQIKRTPIDASFTTYQNARPTKGH